MSEIASAKINSFGKSPKADIASPDDPILEIPLSEFQGLLEEMVLTHNQIAEMIRDAGALRGREISKMVTRTSDSLKATRSPVEKLTITQCLYSPAFSEGSRSPEEPTGRGR